jgi:hypothetical protein
MNDVSVNIEHVVLDGASTSEAQGHQLAHMTGAALRHLFEQQGLSPQPTNVDISQLTTTQIDLPFGASDEQIAYELAHALFRALQEMR